MDETTGQIPNVGQQLDGSTDAEESQRLVKFILYLYINKFNITCYFEYKLCIISCYNDCFNNN
jgi:hypothetical protein